MRERSRSAATLGLGTIFSGQWMGIEDVSKHGKVALSNECSLGY